MKILTVNCYYGEAFGTGKIMKDIENVLRPLGCEFIHCYEAGEKEKEENAYRLSGNIEYRVYYVMSHISGLQYRGGVFSNIRLWRIIRKQKPDIIHIHCPNAFSINLYWLLNYLKVNDIATVITNHAEFFFTANCAHAEECTGYLDGCDKCIDFKKASNSLFFNRTSLAWKKMKQAFTGFRNISMVAVSPWEENRIKNSVICRGLPCDTIFNGIDTKNVFYYRKNDKILKKYKNQTGQKFFLHVTSRFSDDIDDQKGGIYLLKLAERLQKMDFRCKILVVGPFSLKKQYDNLKNIDFIGEISDQIFLAELYSNADLTIMTSRKETFGLTCAESMCCGTPVVGFKNGGTESIALKQYSDFTAYGDVGTLSDLVIQWSEKKGSFYKELERCAAEIYSKEVMAMNYYKLYKHMLNENP